MQAKPLILESTCANRRYAHMRAAGGLAHVTVLGVDERLRQPDEVCVDL